MTPRPTNFVGFSFGPPRAWRHADGGDRCMPKDDAGFEGRYANEFRIGFNSYEFVLDFGQQYPPSEQRMLTRIVASPPVARDLSETLDQSIREYESKFGPIKFTPAKEGE